MDEVSVNLDEVMNSEDEVTVTLRYEDFLQQCEKDQLQTVFREGVRAAAEVVLWWLRDA